MVNSTLGGSDVKEKGVGNKRMERGKIKPQCEG